MYEACFDLKDRPFSAVPRTDHYFPASTIEAARSTLVRCISRGEGVALVIGSAGVGKSMLCEVLAERFEPQFQVAQLTGGHLDTRRALLQAVLYELGQPYRDMDEGELRLALADFVTLGEGCDRGILLLVDEAHHLSLRLLDEIRAFTNLMRHRQPAVRLVMAGNHLLEERFASPKLDSLSQRVSARCYLEPFGQSETQAYIHSRIAVCGGRGADLFPAETCQMVHKATDGVPRLINQICDHALLLAQDAGLRRIVPVHIEEAWADLQQLPAPWSESTRAPSGAVVEFGSLDDDVTTHESNEEPTFNSDIVDDPAMERILFRLADVPDDDPIATTPAFDETDGKLSHIQRLLDDIQAEFRIGSSTTRGELFADEVPHPFREDFAEEEVIADRFASMELPRAGHGQEAFSLLSASPGALDHSSVVLSQHVEKRQSTPMDSELPNTITTFATAPFDSSTTTTFAESNRAVMPESSGVFLVAAMPDYCMPWMSAPTVAATDPNLTPAMIPEVVAEAPPLKPAGRRTSKSRRPAVSDATGAESPATVPLIRPESADRGLDLDKDMVAMLGNVESKPPRPAQLTSQTRKAFSQLFGKLRRAT